MAGSTASPPYASEPSRYPGADPPRYPLGYEPAVTASAGAPMPGEDLIYAIGTISVDYGTEARRDEFRQQMSHSEPPSWVRAEDLDTWGLDDYLANHPQASDKLIWVLNVDCIPTYALVPGAPVGITQNPLQTEAGPDLEDVVGYPAPPVLASPEPPELPPSPTAPVPIYKAFRWALTLRDKSSFVGVSIPGVLTGQTVRLLSGHELPVVEIRVPEVRLWSYLADVAAEKMSHLLGEEEPNREYDPILNMGLSAALNKLSLQFRNLGQSPSDRALNYAATSAVMITDEFFDGLLAERHLPTGHHLGGLYLLDTVSVAPSPVRRADSDCWDVSLTFFHPLHRSLARVTYLFTIDVSNELPVACGPTRRLLGS